MTDHLFITRHLQMEHIHLQEEPEYEISAICPGVMAQTGIETVEIIRGICDNIDVDAVVVVDALAARSSRRLNKTIQTIGAKVIALGVPTVISVPSIIDGSLDVIADTFNQSYGKKLMESFSEQQRYELAYHLAEPELADMFVTPKNIDELVKRISFTISEAINSMIFT